MAASQQEKGVGIRKKTLRKEKRKGQWGTSWGEKKKIRLHIYNISQFPRANYSGSEKNYENNED